MRNIAKYLIAGALVLGTGAAGAVAINQVIEKNREYQNLLTRLDEHDFPPRVVSDSENYYDLVEKIRELSTDAFLYMYTTCNANTDPVYREKTTTNYINAAEKSLQILREWRLNLETDSPEQTEIYAIADLYISQAKWRIEVTKVIRSYGSDSKEVKEIMDKSLL